MTHHIIRLGIGAVAVTVLSIQGATSSALVTSSGRSTWFVGVFVLMVYLVFAMTLFLLPPRQSEVSRKDNVAIPY